MPANHFLLISGILALASGACNRLPPAAVAETDVRTFKYVHIPVPQAFDKSAFWNDKSICPEKATLLPLAKYRTDPNDPAFKQGFQFYYGRRCAILTFNEGTTVSRTLASADNHDSVTVTPHGPFVWWYENGRVMTEGNYLKGVINGAWQDYSPSGKKLDAE